jgi:N-acetylmuramoyl-L-alanine amidase
MAQGPLSVRKHIALKFLGDRPVTPRGGKDLSASGGMTIAELAAQAVTPSCAIVLSLLLAATGYGADAAPAGSKPAIFKDARLAGDRERTRFIADLSKKVEIHAFALGDPYRVIVDLPDVAFQMPTNLGQEKRGLVTGYRYGLFAPGKSRIVIDVNSPFLIDRAFVLEAREDQPARLVVDLIPTDQQTFFARLRESKPASSSSEIPTSAPPASSRPANSKPVVILDPGHGGVDPGAISTSGIAEKELVLAFAKTLKLKLEGIGHCEVYLTREDDNFVPLRKRVEFAQSKVADLFISIHADSIPNHVEQASGATVYTLSEQASDEEAKELASQENLSDAIAGFEGADGSDEVVANILIDLAQRETQNRSLVFARSVIGELRGKTDLHARSLKSAGFRVLKAPDVPSVLLELGFLSNPENERRLTSAIWRAKMADTVAEAIDAYLAKRRARLP